MVEVRFFARMEWTAQLTDWEKAQALERFHIWNPVEIENRFTYESAGLNLAFVRIFRLTDIWRFPDDPKYGGCRSWVELPEPPAGLGLEVVNPTTPLIRSGNASFRQSSPPELHASLARRLQAM